MEFPLIKGQFNKKDALDLITELTKVKIKFHEQKIKTSSHEEDIKSRETRIKQLQEQLHKLKTAVINNEHLSINSIINIK